MKKISILLLVLVIAMVGCSKGNELRRSQEVKGTIQVPESIKPNEKISIKILVTQGDKKIEDADDVQFQVEKEGYINQEMTEAKHQGNGVYSTDYTFKEDGEYMITAHVTVKGDMKMFRKKVTVGTPEKKQ
ncbi:FixH family protein [Priestia aryabhattai]|uniref:FixH family protein n=1 Tax=Priestia TaxID=2800373 RepID=UPI001E49245C|nr:MULTISPECIES: FixH family protein [Priestia]MCE4093204.1 FixH family protein [Priestia megaterium]MED3821846.1 FixH family protein [Priestia aryabhattai]